MLKTQIQANSQPTAAKKKKVKYCNSLKFSPGVRVLCDPKVNTVPTYLPTYMPT